MGKKIHFVTVNGQELSCAQFEGQITLMLAKCHGFASRLDKSLMKRYYDAAEHLRDLLLELQEGNRETGEHLQIIREFYGWDKEAVPDDAIPEKLFLEIKKIMPLTWTFYNEAVKRTAEFKPMILERIKEEVNIPVGSDITQLSFYNNSFIPEILAIQQAKADNADYSRSELAKENEVVKFLCKLSIESAFSEYISLGLLKTSVELDIVDEFDISDLLESTGDNRDYEWYMEDAMSCDLHDVSEIRVNDILRLAADGIAEIHGFKLIVS